MTPTRDPRITRITTLPGRPLRAGDRPSRADDRHSGNETGFGKRWLEQVLLVPPEELLGPPRLGDDEPVVLGPTDMNHESIRRSALIVQTSLHSAAQPIVVILRCRIDDDPDDYCHFRTLLGGVPSHRLPGTDLCGYLRSTS
jgi:hypothetical protein